MTDSRWYAYATRLIGYDNAQTASARAGINASAFSRWKNGANPDPEVVVKLARAYEANVLEALTEAGLISEGEASLHEVAVGKVEALRNATRRELLDELLRREG